MSSTDVIASAARAHCLVTGGAGFIGSHVAERLLALGHRVRVLDNLSTGARANLESLGGVEFVEGAVQDAATCARAVDGVDVVFHLAALGSVPRSIRDSWGSHDANVNGTLRLLEAARSAGVRRVVYSSSSSVYGDTPTLPKVETVEPLCRSPYAAGKLASEQYTLAYARAGLVEGVALRYFNVFGPRQSPEGAYAAVIPLFMRAALAGGTARVNGDGGQTRDFTYVDNVVRANLLAAFGPADRVNGQVVNVGAGDRTSLLRLLELICEVSGGQVTVEHAPAREGDVRDSLAGLERARAVLGYEVEVPLAEGLRRTWAWFAESNAGAGAREVGAGRAS
jgi:nucleoside-diphosphate-sugar epimerase